MYKSCPYRDFVSLLLAGSIGESAFDPYTNVDVCFFLIYFFHMKQTPRAIAVQVQGDNLLTRLLVSVSAVSDSRVNLWHTTVHTMCMSTSAITCQEALPPCINGLSRELTLGLLFLLHFSSSSSSSPSKSF